ncbi:amidohydrolase family protein [Gordonia sp. DT219]|uniref:amidohydrolase family protein n=1 Tax=Gordonia sp. DT219 TaxID=3416658 RepID=UPI003CEC9D62
MSTMTLRGALAIVGAESEHSDAIHIRDGHIVSADADVPGDTEVVDCTDCVVTPGLVNAHHHLLQTAFRTLPGSRFRPMREWLQVMATAYRRMRVDPELCAAAAAVGLAESLLAGVTTVADHHLTWPAGVDPVDLAGATIAAARDAGARLVFVRGTAGDDPHAAADSVRAIHDAHLVDPSHGVSADGMTQLATGPSGVHADSPDTFRELATVAAELGLRRRTQANEQVDVRIAQERYGARPLQLLEDWGWLDRDVTVAHLCDITTDEIAALARSGAHATHAPGCDIPMGWGIAGVADFQDAGIVVGLGTSGGGSNDGGHLLADARLAMQVSGLIGRPLSARTLLTAATQGSATGLGRAELGHLRVGAAADLCVWDCGDVDDAGVADPVDGLLWASPGRRPRDVMVAGRWVVRDHRLVGQDSRGLAEQLRRLLRDREASA